MVDPDGCSDQAEGQLRRESCRIYRSQFTLRGFCRSPGTGQRRTCRVQEIGDPVRGVLRRKKLHLFLRTHAGLCTVNLRRCRRHGRFDASNIKHGLQLADDLRRMCGSQWWQRWGSTRGTDSAKSHCQLQSRNQVHFARRVPVNVFKHLLYNVPEPLNFRLVTAL